MSSDLACNEVHAEHVARAGRKGRGVAAGKHEMLADLLGRRLAETRPARNLSQPEHCGPERRTRRDLHGHEHVFSRTCC
jgi:hypothetical protein